MNFESSLSICFDVKNDVSHKGGRKIPFFNLSSVKIGR